MKTLVLTGGTFPKKETALPVLEKVLGDLSDGVFIIAADSGLKIADEYGLVPDLILGDLDSVAPHILEKFKNLPKTTFIRDKDYPDTELALKTARGKGSELTVLLGGGGGRLDHLFSIERFFQTDFAPDFWIPDENILAKIDGEESGGKKSEFVWNDFFGEKTLDELFSKDYDGNTGIDDALMISVFPCGKGDFSIEDEGLFWSLKNVDWKSGNYSLSNRPASKNVPVKLKAKKGRFIIVFRTKLFLK